MKRDQLDEILAKDKKKNLFQCEACGGTFEKGCTNQQALEEMKKNFGDLPEENQAVICDVCYQKFMKWYNQEQGKRGH